MDTFSSYLTYELAIARFLGLAISPYNAVLVCWLGVSDRKGQSMAALRLGEAAEAEGVG